MPADATGKKAEDEQAEEDDGAGTEHGNRFTRLHCPVPGGPRDESVKGLKSRTDHGAAPGAPGLHSAPIPDSQDLHP
jgi:hypothetical protein